MNTGVYGKDEDKGLNGLRVMCGRVQQRNTCMPGGEVQSYVQRQMRKEGHSVLKIKANVEDRDNAGYGFARIKQICGGHDKILIRRGRLRKRRVEGVGERRLSVTRAYAIP